MERSVHISSVVNVDVSCIVAKNATIIVNMQSTDSANPTIVIPDIYVSDLRYTSIIIIKNRCVLYLDYGPIIIVLNKWIIVVS